MAPSSNLSTLGATPDNPITIKDNSLDDDVPSTTCPQHVVIEGEVLLGEWRQIATLPRPVVVGKVVRGRPMLWCVLPRDIHGDKIPRFAARACHHIDVDYLPAFPGNSLVRVTLQVWEELKS